MITIKQKQEKWRIEINGEEWQFENYDEFGTCLSKILEMKKNNGQVKDSREY